MVSFLFLFKGENRMKKRDFVISIVFFIIGFMLTTCLLKVCA